MASTTQLHLDRDQQAHGKINCRTMVTRSSSACKTRAQELLASSLLWFQRPWSITCLTCDASLWRDILKASFKPPRCPKRDRGVMRRGRPMEILPKTVRTGTEATGTIRLMAIAIVLGKAECFMYSQVQDAQGYIAGSSIYVACSAATGS